MKYAAECDIIIYFRVLSKIPVGDLVGLMRYTLIAAENGFDSQQDAAMQAEAQAVSPSANESSGRHIGALFACWSKFEL